MQTMMLKVFTIIQTSRWHIKNAQQKTMADLSFIQSEISEQKNLLNRQINKDMVGKLGPD